MQRFKNILVYTTGKVEDRAVLERAMDLAARNRAHLTVVGVLRELPRDLRLLAAALPLDALQSAAMKDMSDRLNAMMAQVRPEFTAPAVNILCGTPFMEVIREVLKNRHDLVMLAAEGGVREMFLGSASLRLMRKCPCPVWCIKPGQHTHFRRIMAAVDPSPDDAIRTEVNRKVMDLAISLARLEASELHVVHVCDTSEVEALPGAGVSMALGQIEELHRQQMEGMVGQYDLTNVRHQTHLLRGRAADMISQFTSDKRIDLLVMGTLARTGIAGLFIGNTAEAVLHQVNCSVLTVKPEGFVTPVKREDA